MPMTEPLFFDDLNDVLKHIVQVLGGTKVVATTMRGDMSVESATTWLRKCLDRSSRERLDPEQVEALVRMGRNAGCHAYMHYMAATMNYSIPSPLSQEDVKAHASAEAMRAIAEIAAIYNRLQKQGIRLEDLAGAAAS